MYDFEEFQKVAGNLPMVEDGLDLNGEFNCHLLDSFSDFSQLSCKFHNSEDMADVNINLSSKVE